MKTILAAAALSIAAAIPLPAQQKLDLTVHDGNRLRPGASQREIREWKRSRVIEEGFAVAIEQARSPSASSFSSEQIQTIRMCAIRGKILDPLVAEQPQLKPEADALYVRHDTQLSQQTLPMNPSLTAEQVRLIVTLAVRATIYTEVLATHPNLKARADALYVQYDNEVSAALINAQKRGR